MRDISAVRRRVERCLFTALLFLPCFASLPAAADVDRVEVLERTVLGDGASFGNVGPYERLRGRLHFAIEAAAPENQSIVDLRLAPRDAQGRITFAVDFTLFRPLDSARSNGRLLYEPANSGDITLISTFNNAAPSNVPATATETGNGFLLEQGYTILSTGWNWDVPLGGARLRADLPLASDAGKPLYGRTGGEIAVTQATNSARHVAQGTIGIEPLSPNDENDVLTVRDSALGARTAIPRSRWRFGYTSGGSEVFDPAVITLEGGFKPGAIYSLTYTVRGPRVAGLGLAAIRDALLFFRYERADRSGTPNPLATAGGTPPRTVLAYGTGQSARVLQSMVYYGLVADGRGRLAFDGAMITAAGSGRGNFNSRFAQAARALSGDLGLDFPSDAFPFATVSQIEPVTMATGSVLDRPGPVPKLFYINTPTEYWTRAASLTHTALDASADLTPDSRSRIYMIAGASQTPAATGERNTLAHCRDPLDYRPLLRAMLLHLDGWVTLKKEPPPSMIPSLADGTLGRLAQYLEKFPKVPGLRSPTRVTEPPRLDFGARFATEGIADLVPPRIGKTYPIMVPLSDADGLDQAGIRLPEISAPLGTYTGWNMQNAATGAPERLARTEGSFLPFETDENGRLAAGDPRPSIKERYPTRDAYTKVYAAATLALAENELILGSDVNPMIERAGAFYDRILARAPDDESCTYLGK